MDYNTPLGRAAALVSSGHAAWVHTEADGWVLEAIHRPARHSIRPVGPDRIVTLVVAKEDGSYEISPWL